MLIYRNDQTIGTCISTFLLPSPSPLTNGEGVGKGPTIADGLSDRHGQQEVLLLDAGLFRVGHGHYTVSPQQQCAVGDLLDFCGFRASQRRKRATARRGVARVAAASARTPRWRRGRGQGRKGRRAVVEKPPLASLPCARSTFNKAIIFDEGYCGMGDNTTG